MIICRTPLRISFFGGGTDFPQWYKKNKGMILATTINKYTYIHARFLPRIFSYKFNYRIRYFRNEECKNVNEIIHPAYKAIIKSEKLENKSIELIHNSDLPALSGMGSSSSNTVSVINALQSLKKIKKSKILIAKEALRIEQKTLKEFVGSQDQIVTALGGFNLINFYNNNFVVKKISHFENIKSLEKSILLVFTGLTRSAQKIEKSKIKLLAKNASLYNEMYSIAKNGASILRSKNFNIKDFGMLLSETWKIKKKLGKNISNKHIDEMYFEGLKNGAFGGKLLGAGSGGFLLFICNRDSEKKLKKIFKNYYIIPVKFENEGTKIIYEN